MKITAVVAALTVLCALLLAATPATAAPGLIDLSNVNFFDSVTINLKAEEKKITFVLFWAPWSQVSLAMNEDYKEVSRHFHKKKMSHVMISRVNVGESALEIIAHKQKVRNFPTLKLYVADEEPIAYKGDYAAEEMIEFLEKHLKRLGYSGKSDDEL